MQTNSTVDVLILGRGVIGLTSALELARRHPELTIAILDAPTSAMVASRAAAGMLSPGAEFGDDSPLARLGEQSLALYPDFVRTLEEQTGMDIGLRWMGTLIPQTEGGEEEFEQKLADLQGSGAEHRLLEGEDLRRAEPQLNPVFQRAIWLPEGVLNTLILHDALQQSADRLGIAFLEGQVVAAEREDEHVTALKLKDGRIIRFSTLVAATGAWTDDIAEILGLNFGIRPIKGQVARVEAPDGLVRHIFHLPGFYMAPRNRAGVILGSTMEEAGFDSSIDDEVVARFVDEANNLFPALVEYPLAETWAGFRPRSADGLPIIGWISPNSNVLVATGHFRNGILLTPITGQMVATLFDDPYESRWEAFSPRRPSLSAGIADQ